MCPSFALQQHFTRDQFETPSLCRLHYLFEKDLSKALQIVDKGHIKCYIAEKSGRSVFQA